MLFSNKSDEAILKALDDIDSFINNNSTFAHKT